MSVSSRDEDSGPGHKPGSGGYAVLHQRIKTAEKQVEDLWEATEEMGDEISDVKKVQISQGVKLETLIEFHQELKKYARWAVTGVFGLIALQIAALIFKKGIP